MADKAQETPAHQQLTTKEADLANVRPGNMNSGEKEGGPSNVRQDLVETAARFLNNSKVQGSSLESRKSFLRKKGLNDAEIELAIAKAKEVNPGLGMQIAQAPPTYATAPPLPTKDLQVTPRRGWMDYTLAAVIIAGVSYVVVMFIKKYILGWFWKREEQLDQKMETIKDTLDQTRQEFSQAVEGIREATEAMHEVANQQRTFLSDMSMEAVQENNKRLLQEVKSDITSIKGLILGKSQFPSPPTTSGIPAWQKSVTLPPSSPFEKVDVEDNVPLVTPVECATNDDKQGTETA